MRLVVNEPGTFVGTRGGMIVVTKKGKKLLEVAVPKIDEVVILTRGASISSALVRLLLKHGIPILFYSSGRPIAICKGFTSGAVSLRKRQYEAQGKEIGIELAKSFASGKMMNQYRLIYSMAKNRSKSDPILARELYGMAREIRRKGEEVLEVDGGLDELRKGIMGIEADAAKIYWECVSKALSKVIDFPGRKKRFDSPHDPVNISLNYLYSILAGECWIDLEAFGLDPFVGFLHVDSPRRPALAMDRMEEFRQPVVDRVVFRLAFERKLEGILEGNRLSRDARLMLYKAYSKRIESKVTFLNRSLPIREHMLLQAKRVAMHLMEREKYTPFRI